MELYGTGEKFRMAAAQTSRLIRWLMIGAVGLSYDFNLPHGYGIAILLCAATAFTLTQYLHLPRKLAWWKSPLTSVIFDLIWISAVLALAGGTDSRYFFFYILPGMLAGYTGGRWLMRAVVLIQAGATLGILFVDRSLSLTATRETLAWLVVLLVLEWQAGELLAADRRQRIKTEETNTALEAERQRLLALINSMASAVAVVDHGGRVTLYNGALLELLDTNRQLQGQPLSVLLPVTDPAGLPVSLSDLATESLHILRRTDLVYAAGDGTKINLEVVVSPIHQPNSQPISAGGSVVMVRDITKEKTLDEQRDEFISLASHELRTPLAIAEANLSTAILPGFARIEPKALALINQAHDNVVFLGQLIKDLTDLSMAEAGKIRLNLVTVDSAQLLGQLGENYRAEAEAKGLTLKVAQPSPVPPIVTSEHQIREILQNFITNAIKYTQKGGIEIGAEADETGKQVVYWVRDSGIGIATSDQRHLFTKFYRSEDYRTRQTSGTGLGLYITKKLAELLHGRVWFKSRLNRGSTFYLQVPSFPEPPAAPKS